MPRRPRKDEDPTAAALPARQPNLNAAAIDVGGEAHFVAVPPDRDPQPVRSFGPFTSDLAAMAAWLKACRIDTVALESTGHFWIPVYDALEAAGLVVVLVDPRTLTRHLRKKSDVIDCQWLQDLHALGLLKGCFRPDDQVRALRALWRHRARLVVEAGTILQRIQKVLVEMNVHLHLVVADVAGATGMRIIRAILKGQRDPAKLAQLRDKACRRSEAEIARALQGSWREEHLFELKQLVRSWDFHRDQAAGCDRQFAKACSAMPDKGEGRPLDGAAKQPQEHRNTPEFDGRALIHRMTGVDLTAVDGLGDQHRADGGVGDRSGPVEMANGQALRELDEAGSSARSIGHANPLAELPGPRRQPGGAGVSAGGSRSVAEPDGAGKLPASDEGPPRSGICDPSDGPQAIEAVLAPDDQRRSLPPRQRGRGGGKGPRAPAQVAEASGGRARDVAVAGLSRSGSRRMLFRASRPKTARGGGDCWRKPDLSATIRPSVPQSERTVRGKAAKTRRGGAMATRRLSRNDPCHCGSGRKYKKCCLATEPFPRQDYAIGHPQPVYGEDATGNRAGAARPDPPQLESIVRVSVGYNLRRVVRPRRGPLLLPYWAVGHPRQQISSCRSSGWSRGCGCGWRTATSPPSPRSTSPRRGNHRRIRPRRMAATPGGFWGRSSESASSCLTSWWMAQAITTTPGHQFWSVDRERWIAAGGLTSWREAPGWRRLDRRSRKQKSTSARACRTVQYRGGGIPHLLRWWRRPWWCPRAQRLDWRLRNPETGDRAAGRGWSGR